MTKIVQNLLKYLQMLIIEKILENFLEGIYQWLFF